MTTVVWDAVNKGSGVTLSNGNLTSVIPNSNNTSRASLGRTIGKWYWEVALSAIGAGGAMVGVVNSQASLTSNNYNTQNVRYYYSTNGYKYPEATTYGTAIVMNDVIGIALDLDNGTIEFFKNGESQGISHTNAKTMGEVFPAVSSGSASVGNTNTANFGATPFKHPVPKGYKSYDGSQNTNTNKILLLGDDGDTRSVSIPNKENLIPNMTSKTSPKGIVSSSGEYNTTIYSSFNVFNDSVNRWYVAKGTAWVQYKFDLAVCINKISIFANTFTAGKILIKNFTLSGSIDGVVFQELYKGLYLENPIEQEYEFNNKSEFLYYRLTVLDSYYATEVCVDRLKMFQEASGTIKSLSSQSEQSFIKNGMSPSDIASIDMSSEFTEKHYIQDTSTPLGEGKVFEQVLDIDKVIKKVTVK